MSADSRNVLFMGICTVLGIFMSSVVPAFIGILIALEFGHIWAVWVAGLVALLGIAGMIYIAFDCREMLKENP